MERWKPRIELTKKEELIMKRLNRVRALFGFLRTKRHLLFDDAFQEQLLGMYRQTGAGDEPHAPAMLCMVVLLQGYVGASDAEAVEMAVMDRRWQLVLDCLDVEEPPFAQGALQAFRQRMVEHGMDQILLERTVALVREGVVSAAEGQQLSKAVRVAIDSRPLAGAGRVEDTINLLGHATRSIVKLVAKLTDRAPEEICRKAGIPLLLSPSIKAGLDIDWSDLRQKAQAIQIVEQGEGRALSPAGGWDLAAEGARGGSGWCSSRSGVRLRWIGFISRCLGREQRARQSKCLGCRSHFAWQSVDVRRAARGCLPGRLNQ